MTESEKATALANCETLIRLCADKAIDCIGEFIKSCSPKHGSQDKEQAYQLLLDSLTLLVDAGVAKGKLLVLLSDATTKQQMIEKGLL